MAVVSWDKNGVRLANVPGSGVSSIDPNAKSGNPRHDTRSGKFGTGGPRQPATPANTSPDAYTRMWDAVRAAARELGQDVGDDQLRKFLQGRSASPDLVDLQAFGQLVSQQRQNDLVDVIAADLRGGGTRVRVTVPQGWVKKQIGTPADQGTLTAIMGRLVAQGINADQVKSYFKAKVGSDADVAHAKVTGQPVPQQPGQKPNQPGQAKPAQPQQTVAAADWPLLSTEDGIVFMEPPPPDPAAIAASIAQNMPQPRIEVTVPITMPERKPMTIKRNPDTGLIEEVE